MGTVPLDSVEESEVRKLAFERLRSSLKKGMAVGKGIGSEGVLTVNHRPEGQCKGKGLVRVVETALLMMPRGKKN